MVLDAYESARFLCDQYYLASPEMKLVQHNEVENNRPIQMIYVPSHLYHILFEVFKNSMRAVMEHHGQNVDDIPALEVTVVGGREDICVKISDRGGGIPRSQVDQIFKYMYSTAPQPSKSEMHTVPLAGKIVFFLFELMGPCLADVLCVRLCFRIRIWSSSIPAICSIFAWRFRFILLRRLWNRCHRLFESKFACLSIIK